MNVNGITSKVAEMYQSEAKPVKKEEKAKVREEKAAVYEPSKEAKEYIKNQQNKVVEKKKVDNAKIVEQMKADNEARIAQFKDMVQQMILQQTGSKDTDIWQFLREGKFTVTAEQKAQAEEEISEDGYWGVEKTSQRIVDFAMALCGDDTKQIEKMRDAFKKGYEQAEKTWGGELPEISKKTYDAVMEKFDKLSEE